MADFEGLFASTHCLGSNRTLPPAEIEPSTDLPKVPTLTAFKLYSCIISIQGE